MHEGGKAHSPESPPTLIPAQGRLQTQGAVTSGYSGAVPSQGQEPLTLPNLPWAHTWGLHSAPCLLYEQNSLRKHKLLKQFIVRCDARIPKYSISGGWSILIRQCLINYSRKGATTIRSLHSSTNSKAHSFTQCIFF